jgi:GNAT superfamily N-acetyltransferase
MSKHFVLRPGEPERDFGQLASWFSDLEGEPNTESGLKKYYERKKDLITQMVAEDDRGELSGFYWTIRDVSKARSLYFYLYVKPERRRQGLGSRLYEDLVEAAREAQVKTLRTRVWDDCPECWTFAERCGFTERGHSIMMMLNLDAFDDLPYDEVIARLKREGFRFTSMEELGNTEEAQHRLYVLNDATAMDMPGSDGSHSWESFEDFQQSVCQADWYKPGGQMVVIDTVTGNWAAMSAITRLEGNDYAYNLHTGVDKLYRGRKLGQAVKVLALRYARDTLKTRTVRTQHNVENLPMIAIDRKFGYMQMPGTYLMEKDLE